MYTHFGFTGTQRGMTEEQTRRLGHVFAEIMKEHEAVAFHHGDCIGADFQAHALFHDMFLGTEAVIRIHPPEVRDKRAFSDKARHGMYARLPVLIDAELPYLARNKRIVTAVADPGFLIAAPHSHAEVGRSGTWATCREARRQGERVYVVYPDGSFNSDWV